MKSTMFHSLTEAWREQRRIAEAEAAISALDKWYRTPFGEALLAAEQRLLDEELSCLFGYHLMQLSMTHQVSLHDKSRICHCFGISPSQSDTPGKIGALGTFEALPLPDESVDVSILHHVLEFSSNPHQVLKEASRVTIANGYVILLGFNPISPLGMVKPFARHLSSNPFWRRHSLRRSRVIDWLQFLDFSVQKSVNGFFNIPLNNKTLLQSSERLNAAMQRWRLPFGNFYCIVARKDVARMTLIRPNWEKESFLPGVKIANSAVVSAQMGSSVSRIKSAAGQLSVSSGMKDAAKKEAMNGTMNGVMKGVVKDHLSARSVARLSLVRQPFSLRQK